MLFSRQKMAKVAIQMYVTASSYSCYCSLGASYASELHLIHTNTNVSLEFANLCPKPYSLQNSDERASSFRYWELIFATGYCSFSYKCYHFRSVVEHNAFPVPVWVFQVLWVCSDKVNTVTNSHSL